MKTLDYRVCLGLNKIDRYCWNLSTGQVNDAFQNALGRSPTGQELAQYTSNGSFDGGSGQQSLISQLKGGSPNASSPASMNNGVSNPIQTAQQLLEFQKQANQPAIQQLQSTIDPLQQRYNDLITSIKGQGTVAQNYAQQSASMDLGRRGLMPQSQEGQAAIGQALLPAQQQTQGQLSQVGLGEQQDIQGIQSQIAQLQAGNPESATQNALQLYSAQAQIQQAALERAIQQQSVNQQGTAIANQSALLPLQIAQTQAQTGLAGAEAGQAGAQTQLLNLQTNPNALMQYLTQLGGGNTQNNTQSGRYSFVAP